VLSKQWLIHVSPLEWKWPMYTSPLVTEQPMRWVSSLFGFVWLSAFRFMHHSPKTGGYVDNQNCPFSKVVKIRNRPHHCVPLVKIIKKHIWKVQFGVQIRELCFQEDVSTSVLPSQTRNIDSWRRPIRTSDPLSELLIISWKGWLFMEIRTVDPLLELLMFAWSYWLCVKIRTSDSWKT